MNAVRLRTDVQAFEQTLAQDALVRAVDLYAGPFLDGFYLSNTPEFERRMEGERDRLARLHQAALESLAGQRENAGDQRGAADTWRKLSLVDPFNSRIAGALMEAFAAAGDRAGALQHARIHEAVLREEFGAGPAREILALAARLRQEPSAASPATRWMRPSRTAPARWRSSPGSYVGPLRGDPRFEALLQNVPL